SRLKPVPPAAAVAGESDVSSGTPGTVMKKSASFDVPPPGGAVKTVILAVPTAARSLAGMVASRTVLLRKLVGRSAPFQRTTDAGTNFVPVTVKVKAAPPAAALAGASVLTTGTGDGPASGT